MCKCCCCELSKAELSKQCAYTKGKFKYNLHWSTFNSFADYQPSTLLQPELHGLPAIVDGKHLHSSEPMKFIPMYWTLIPPWNKGNLKFWNGETYIARVENLLGISTNLYSTSLDEGQRCIVVMEGFFQKKFVAEGAPEEVYYFYSPQNKLLKAAGLFGIKKMDNGNTLYSCNIITTESKNDVKKIHHRSPLLLHKDADVKAWLDFKNVSSSDAVSKIRSIVPIDLKFHKTAMLGSTVAVVEDKNDASENMVDNWHKNGTNKGAKRKLED